MRQSPLTAQKKAKILKTAKDLHKSGAVKFIFSRAIAKKSGSRTNIMTRYTKRGLKSMLLSPVFHSIFKISMTACVVTGMLYGSYLYINKTFANEVVVSQSEIVARVGKLTLLPGEAPYEIVRVQDEEDLRKQNDFYKDVKEGDYIMMYKKVAIIYDLRNNTIVAIKRE